MLCLYHGSSPCFIKPATFSHMHFLQFVVAFDVTFDVTLVSLKCFRPVCFAILYAKILYVNLAGLKTIPKSLCTPEIIGCALQHIQAAFTLPYSLRFHSFAMIAYMISSMNQKIQIPNLFTYELESYLEFTGFPNVNCMK